MALPEPYNFFLDPLERSGLTYCVTGSVAAGLYGEPRTTRDIDVVLMLRLPDIATFQAIFLEEEFYLPPVEAILTEVRRTQLGLQAQWHIVLNPGPPRFPAT